MDSTAHTNAIDCTNERISKDCVETISALTVMEHPSLRRLMQLKREREFAVSIGAESSGRMHVFLYGPVLFVVDDTHIKRPRLLFLPLWSCSTHISKEHKTLVLTPERSFGAQAIKMKTRKKEEINEWMKSIVSQCLEVENFKMKSAAYRVRFLENGAFVKGHLIMDNSVIHLLKTNHLVVSVERTKEFFATPDFEDPMRILFYTQNQLVLTLRVKNLDKVRLILFAVNAKPEPLETAPEILRNQKSEGVVVPDISYMFNPDGSIKLGEDEKVENDTEEKRQWRLARRIADSGVLPYNLSPEMFDKVMQVKDQMAKERPKRQKAITMNQLIKNKCDDLQRDIRKDFKTDKIIVQSPSRPPKYNLSYDFNYQEIWDQVSSKMQLEMEPMLGIITPRNEITAFIEGVKDSELHLLAAGAFLQGRTVPFDALNTVVMSHAWKNGKIRTTREKFRIGSRRECCLFFRELITNGAGGDFFLELRKAKDVVTQSYSKGSIMLTKDLVRRVARRLDLEREEELSEETEQIMFAGMRYPEYNIAFEVSQLTKENVENWIRSRFPRVLSGMIINISSDSNDLLSRVSEEMKRQADTYKPDTVTMTVSVLISAAKGNILPQILVNAMKGAPERQRRSLLFSLPSIFTMEEILAEYMAKCDETDFVLQMGRSVRVILEGLAGKRAKEDHITFGKIMADFAERLGAAVEKLPGDIHEQFHSNMFMK